MKHSTTKYVLHKNGVSLEFNSEKEACEFLDVARCSVASCCRRGRKCKGYTVERVGITTHHETNTRLHRIWGGMHDRCRRENHEYFKDYGGRGISVCEEWSEYIPFRDWALANGYKESLTLDRKDINGNYSPNNCRWVTVKEQQNNKRSNHTVKLNGVSRTITEWSEILGLNKTTIKERLKSGWSDEEALTTPVRKRTRGYRPSGSRMDGE